MTQEINDGGPAFPHDERDANGQFRQHFGMTLRDWFAGQVTSEEIKAMTDNVSAETCEAWLGLAPGEYKWFTHFPHLVAKVRLTMADAMIAARCAHAKSDSASA